MKKIFALLLAMLMVVSMVACGAKEEPPVEEPAPEVEEEVAPETEEPAPEVEEPAEPETEEPAPEVEEPAEPETEEPAPEAEEEMAPAASNGATDILNAIWAVTPDEEKFPAAGGDENNMAMDAPGVVGIDNANYLSGILLVPADQHANIVEAGNLMHMMNANTFTSGVYALAEGTSIADFAAIMEEVILNNQWICGFPEQLLIVDLGTHVLVAFGNSDIMASFAAHTAEAYPDSTVLYDEPIG